MRGIALSAAVGAAVLAWSTGPGAADTLRVGLAAEPTAVDPHYHDQGPNDALAMQIYDALLTTDAQQKVEPNLATSWKNRDDHTWIFDLRPDVTFSNGKPFTADDVIFTFCRVLHNETSIAGSFSEAAKNFDKVEKSGDHQILIQTKRPDPLLPHELASIAIVSSAINPHGELSFTPDKDCGVTGKWPTVTDFNDGGDAIGTGPFKLKSYVKGSVIDLVRNDKYWGKKPHWDEVKFVPVPNAGPRLAGLLASDYDLIENPASRDLAHIKQSPNLSYVTKPSTRVIFLQLDMRDKSPFIKSEKGNPFQDVRVRRAISMAIDRKAIVERIMDGAAEPAYQFLPTGMPGTLASPPVLKYDPKEAKKLLAEAGYPNGFSVTFDATNDRYINDAQVAQAVTQFLTRVGINTNLDAMTRSIFFTRRSKRDFSFSMGGWGSDTGEASSFLRQWLVTTDNAMGLGGSNYGAWSDPKFDALMKQAVATIDDGKREDLLRQAGAIAVDQLPDIPLYFESTIWAFRKGISYAGRADQLTLAQDVTIKQ